MKKIIIVGGVAAGMSAASKAKRLNKELNITVYEKTDMISWGSCGLPYYVGDFYQDSERMIAKPLEQFNKENKELNITVYEKTDMISWGSCGLPYYVGDFYQDSERMIAKPLEQFNKEGINVKMKHEVIGIDPAKREVTIKDLNSGEIFNDSYDEIIIATGASSIKPPIKNIDLQNIFTLKEFSDGIELKKAILKAENREIVIIGAGYIGLEAVEAATHLRKKVRVIQLSERVLPESFDKEITDIMEEELSSHKDVILNLNETVTEFEGKDGKVTSVITNKGKYSADIVILATGVRPNTKFLENTGIETLRNGAIIIDSRGRSNIDGIYAAGDCASVYHKVKKENVYIKKRMYIFHLLQIQIKLVELWENT